MPVAVMDETGRPTHADIYPQSIWMQTVRTSPAAVCASLAGVYVYASAGTESECGCLPYYPR